MSLCRCTIYSIPVRMVGRHWKYVRHNFFWNIRNISVNDSHLALVWENIFHFYSKRWYWKFGNFFFTFFSTLHSKKSFTLFPLPKNSLFSSGSLFILRKYRSDWRQYYHSCFPTESRFSFLKSFKPNPCRTRWHDYHATPRLFSMWWIEDLWYRLSKSSLQLLWSLPL